VRHALSLGVFQSGPVGFVVVFLYRGLDFGGRVVSAIIIHNSSAEASRTIMLKIGTGGREEGCIRQCGRNFRSIILLSPTDAVPKG
jgi:hypothetical protein